MSAEKLDLANWYKVDIEAYCLNRNWGMPNRKFTGWMGKVIASVVRVAIYCGLTDPRTKPRNEAKDFKRYRRFMNYQVGEIAKWSRDGKKRMDALEQRLNSNIQNRSAANQNQ